MSGTALFDTRDNGDLAWVLTRITRPVTEQTIIDFLKFPEALGQRFDSFFKFRTIIPSRELTIGDGSNLLPMGLRQFISSLERFKLTKSPDRRA